MVTIRNRCSVELMPARYWPPIADVIAGCRRVLAERIVDIRVLGSVPRGEAIDGLSDIDVSCLIEGNPSTADVAEIEQLAAVVSGTFPIVSRGEIDLEQSEGLPPFRRFVLSSDSVSVYGEDRLTLPVQTIDRNTLIHLVTPDASAMLRIYREGVLALGENADPAMLRFWSRIIGKDLLKCLRAEALRLGAEYEPGIAGIHAQIKSLVPDLAGLADRLFDLYLCSAESLAVLLDVLDQTSLALASNSR